MLVSNDVTTQSSSFRMTSSLVSSQNPVLVPFFKRIMTDCLSVDPVNIGRVSRSEDSRLSFGDFYIALASLA
jgi:hypothetical protein